MRKSMMIGLGALSAGLLTAFATVGRRKWKQGKGRPSAAGPQPVKTSSGPDHERHDGSSEVERRTSESAAARA